MKQPIKQVWKITLYQTKRQQVVFTSVYTLKLTKEVTPQQMGKKVRKDFKKWLKSKNTSYEFVRVR